MQSLGVPAWRVAVKAALKKNGKSACAKFAQLATVRASTGAPAVRTVVFRGFGDAFRDDDDDDARDDGDEANALTFCADARSEKIRDIAGDARGEIAWYFPETREQFRVTGTLACATSETAAKDARGEARRRNLWRKMRRGARGQFMWPAPGETRAEVGEGGRDPHDVDEDDARLDDETVGEHFALVALRADRIDHLSLRKNERVMHEIVDGTWTSTRVNP